MSLGIFVSRKKLQTNLITDYTWDVPGNSLLPKRKDQGWLFKKETHCILFLKGHWRLF